MGDSPPSDDDTILGSPSNDQRCIKNDGKLWRCSRWKMQGRSLCHKHFHKQIEYNAKKKNLPPHQKPNKRKLPNDDVGKNKNKKKKKKKKAATSSDDDSIDKLFEDNYPTEDDDDSIEKLFDDSCTSENENDSRPCSKMKEKDDIFRQCLEDPASVSVLDIMGKVDTHLDVTEPDEINFDDDLNLFDGEDMVMTADGADFSKALDETLGQDIGDLGMSSKATGSAENGVEEGLNQGEDDDEGYEILSAENGLEKAFDLLLPFMDDEVEEIRSKGVKKLLRQTARANLRSFVRTMIVSSAVEDESDRLADENEKLKETIRNLTESSKVDHAKLVESEGKVGQLTSQLGKSREELAQVVEKFKVLVFAFSKYKLDVGLKYGAKINDANKAGYFRALKNAKVPKTDPVWTQHKPPFTPPTPSTGATPAVPSTDLDKAC